ISDHPDRTAAWTPVPEPEQRTRTVSKGIGEPEPYLISFAAEASFEPHRNASTCPKAHTDSSSSLKITEVQQTGAREDFSAIGEHHHLNGWRDFPTIFAV